MKYFFKKSFYINLANKLSEQVCAIVKYQLMARKSIIIPGKVSKCPKDIFLDY